MDDVPDRRARWVGLRTLRQRPAAVGATAAGEPVFEVRSVRLVLRGDAPHFNRLVRCSKCDREMPGPPVLSPADLDQPVHAVICAACVREASVPSFGGEAVAAPAEEDDRLAALERRVAEQERRIEALAAAAEDWASRFHALEQRSQASIIRLTRLLGAQGGGRPPARSDLLASLEGQLLGAEERLAQRPVAAGDDGPE